MELPRRDRGDELLPEGSLLRLRERVRALAPAHDVSTVFAYSFDFRTRMLPFIYADLRMAPAGARAIGAAMLDAGFDKTRVVLQQWNPKFKPSRMQLDGRLPDIFMVSSMQLHAAKCHQMLRDVCRIEPDRRPLVIAGGPKAIYEPWDVFGVDPNDPWGADVAVTGEEYVLLSLMEALLEARRGEEPLRATFMRERDRGSLEGIPGLVYAPSSTNGVAEELRDTGIQRLVGDLDELPHPIQGYRILEAPSSRETLGSQPLAANKVGKYSPIGSLVLTFGCKFACPYCPIPAYNQRQHRVKSGERVADEMTSIQREFGIRHFFGADDNFFNYEKKTLDIVEALARARTDQRKRGLKKFRWATEVTVHDTLKLQEHLPLMKKSGLKALWIGVEDMTATLINKGQSVDKTSLAFQLLSKQGIQPMPMMMHSDEQPLISFGPKPHGLLNQVRLLRKAGAISMQVLMLTPATGSAWYTDTFTSGMVYDTVGNQKIEEHMLGGAFVIASKHPKPWRKQLNMLTAYAYFYNPVHMAIALVRPKTRMFIAEAIWQGVGMWGLWQTFRRTIGWVFKLRFGKVTRRETPPMNRVPMLSVHGGDSSHALPLAPRTADDFVKLGTKISSKRALELPVLTESKG
ncbi:MAG: B12-binding domain-containing radical SAM protein [Phycisphaerae bacterium]